MDIFGGIAVFGVVAGIEKWLFLKAFLNPKQQTHGVDKKKIARYKHTLTDKTKIKVHG